MGGHSKYSTGSHMPTQVDYWSASKVPVAVSSELDLWLQEKRQFLKGQHIMTLILSKYCWRPWP